MVVACLVVVFLFYMGGGGGGGDSDSSHGEIHQTLHNEKKPNDVLPSNPAPGESSGPAQNTETMMQNLAKARTDLLSMLRHDYGETNVEALFFETDAASGQRRSRGRSVFRSGDPGSSISWDRTKRKLMMKLLQVMSLESSRAAAFNLFGPREVTARQRDMEIFTMSRTRPLWNARPKEFLVPSESS